MLPELILLSIVEVRFLSNKLLSAFGMVSSVLLLRASDVLPGFLGNGHL